MNFGFRFNKKIMNYKRIKVNNSYDFSFETKIEIKF